MTHTWERYYKLLMIYVLAQGTSIIKCLRCGPQFKYRTEKTYLQGPHDYWGVSVGTYLLLSNFKPGKYRLDFGGISRVPYFTRAVYDITVIETSQPPVNDISSLAAKKSFTPKPLK
jgi:hypothetical protein